VGSGQPAFLDVTRSLTGRAWYESPADARIAEALSQRLGVPDVVGRILAARDVAVDQAETFLNPRLRDALPDPSVFADMDRAADRLVRAITDNETVCVFGDYDVDGATSSALLQRYFTAIGKPLRIYIPDRQREGYGPNAEAMRRLRADGVDVLITVDCGIVAFEALAQAGDAGLDVLVVDHHQAEPQLPLCHAAVNPNRLDDDSGLGQLAAVGVTFMLLIALNRALRKAGWFATRDEPDLLAWLDIVALGTVCDVVPLTGLNRVLVAQGLKVMTQRGNVGLNALQDVAGLSAKPGAYHLGFLLGPRVNAGGRVGRSELGARLLSIDDPMEAKLLAEELDGFNKERQAIESMVLEGADQAAQTQLANDHPLIFVSDSGWHEGVIGIVAGRLKDRYRRPTIVLSINDGTAKGSGRSVKGVDLGAAVTAAKQAGLLRNGGGHAMAAGLTADTDKLPSLADFLTERIAPQVSALSPVPQLVIDAALSVKAASERSLYDTLEQAGPYGAGHPEPRVALPRADIVRASVVGARHVRFVATGDDGGRLNGIAFNAADTELGAALLTSNGRRLHLAGHLRADDWQGRQGVQLHLEDAARAGG
jgi:single-stranded-DNA-specific exonuclease